MDLTPFIEHLKQKLEGCRNEMNDLDEFARRRTTKAEAEVEKKFAMSDHSSSAYEDYIFDMDKASRKNKNNKERRAALFKRSELKSLIKETVEAIGALGRAQKVIDKHGAPGAPGE